MNVSTITMPPEQAREKLAAYRQQLARRADAEYEAAAAGYAALAEGTPLLNITDVIRAAPCDEQGRPKLAVARADREQVRFRWRRRERASFDTHFYNRYGTLRGRRSAALVVEIDMGREPTLADRVWELGGLALVPMVPADVRQKVPGALSDYHVLWEVPAWTPIAPVDPYLLKHVLGDLYAVVAEWDLTELERAIMAGRRG